MVWSLALCPDDTKQDSVVYGAVFGVVFLAKDPRTASIQEGLDCLRLKAVVNRTYPRIPAFLLFQVNGYTFENKNKICGTTSVPIESLHKAHEILTRGLRGQASKRASSTRQSDAPQGACV